MTRGALSLALLLALAAPTQAQQANVPRVGVLMVVAGPGDTAVEAVRRGLHELGYVEGRTINIEYRGAQGHPDRLPALAQELVKLNVSAIVVGAEASARAAKSVTNTIPIVMAMYDIDPVSAGLVGSLNHPGGNITGVFSRQSELVGKRLELLREIRPNLSNVAVLSDSFGHRQLAEVREAARALGIHLEVLEMRAPYNFDAAFASARTKKVDALLVLFSPLFVRERVRIAELAAHSRLMSMFQDSDSVRDGGLVSYGPNIEEVFTRTAYYVDRLLKGAKASELPVEQSTSFSLTINLRTAKRLGFAIPESVVVRADEVVQ
jgi:putative ABC transport system substrate-binding protein